MKNRLIKRKFAVTAIFLAVCLNYIYSLDCSDGYTYFDELPETATVQDGNFCLYNVDLAALDDIISENGLNYDSAINIGSQTWNNGRLTVFAASYNPNGSGGVNEQLEILPDSFGNLTELIILYLEWNSLTSLPNSFSQLTNLISLTINNNWLTNLPDDFGNINNLFFLDLGYNQLTSIPESVCDINFSNTSYLYLFNNNLTSLPDCMCELDINWSGFDGEFPFFGIGGNQLCSNIPECIAESAYFESSLDQFYYSAIIEAPQDIPNLGDLNGDGGHNVLDIVTLANCVLAQNCVDIEYGSVGDLNGDGGYNVLDIVTLANCILAVNCGG